MYHNTANNLLMRRPPGSATSLEDTLGADYILRACKLRREGRIGIVLVECGRYFIATNPSDPWGSKESISHEALRQLIDSIEAETREEAA